jgi:hypothetical protein
MLEKETTEIAQHFVKYIFKREGRTEECALLKGVLSCYEYLTSVIFSMVENPLVGQGLLIIEASPSQSVSHKTLGRTPLDE